MNLSDVRSVGDSTNAVKTSAYQLSFYTRKRPYSQLVERVPWMSPIDYGIIEFYDHHDILLTRKVIAVNIGNDRQYTSKRRRALAEAGQLQQIDKGLYKLSNKGQQFLAGDLDREALENDEE